MSSSTYLRRVSRSFVIRNGLQYECASAAKMDVVVTRDKSGFAGAEIPVLTPTEFVSKYA